MCPFQDKSCTIASFSTPLHKYIIANTVQSLSRGISFAPRTGNVPSVTDLSVPAAVWHPCQWPERCCCQNGFLVRRCAYMPRLFYSHTTAISVCSLKLNCNESKKEKNLNSWLLSVLTVSWITIMDGTACHGLWRWNIYIRGPVALPQKYDFFSKKTLIFFLLWLPNCNVNNLCKSKEIQTSLWPVGELLSVQRENRITVCSIL